HVINSYPAAAAAGGSSERRLTACKLDSVGNLGIWLTAVTPGASLAGHESGEIPEECVMSIRPRLGAGVPELTVRVARASNPGGGAGPDRRGAGPRGGAGGPGRGRPPRRSCAGRPGR